MLFNILIALDFINSSSENLAKFSLESAHEESNSQHEFEPENIGEDWHFLSYHLNLSTPLQSFVKFVPLYRLNSKTAFDDEVPTSPPNNC